VYGAAIYEIKEASLAKMLDLTNSDGASTNYLINDEFQILASTNHNDLTVFLNDPQEMAQITTQDTFQFNQQKYLVQSIPNEELHISVVSVTNPSQALSLVNRVQEHFILIFMCILFVGIIAVTLMGIRNYRPIRKIEHLVREFHKDMEMSVNSMDDVHNTLAAVLEEQQELHK
ncbi:AraC family transcriptional regulator, partial [Klebsiella pneumoniae]